MRLKGRGKGGGVQRRTEREMNHPSNCVCVISTMCCSFYRSLSPFVRRLSSNHRLMILLRSGRNRGDGREYSMPCSTLPNAQCGRSGRVRPYYRRRHRGVDQTIHVGTLMHYHLTSCRRLMCMFTESTQLAHRHIEHTLILSPTHNASLYPLYHTNTIVNPHTMVTNGARLGDGTISPWSPRGLFTRGGNVR